MDINRALKSAVTTGKVQIGQRETLKAADDGHAKLVIVAGNCPDNFVEKIQLYATPKHRFAGTNMQLGSACGKPFPISALAVIDAGNSEILAVEDNI